MVEEELRKRATEKSEKKKDAPEKKKKKKKRKPLVYRGWDSNLRTEFLTQEIHFLYYFLQVQKHGS